MPIRFRLNGAPVEVDDDGASLLETLRDRLGMRSPKDGCSPQGQCGCCTVLVDGLPRVSCVTPTRRIADRDVTTLEGLPAGHRDAWGDAFVACGASQCGFCTPGIVMRLESLRARGAVSGDAAALEKALAAHLCRCTGWRTIIDAFDAFDAFDAVPERGGGARDLAAASRRATIEGGFPQRVGAPVALGEGGFADDLAPRDALVAVPDGRGGWAVAEALSEARALAGKVQGRHTTIDATPPIELPPGDWDLTLRTSWVEPAYLETDASWCEPGGTPASPLANGGAFGGKASSEVAAVARELADTHGRAVRVLLSREDTVRRGPKRPPLAAGVRVGGSGAVRVARTPGIATAIGSVAPALAVTEVDLAGPPTSTAARAAGWAEAAVLSCAIEDRAPARVRAPGGAIAEVEIDDTGIAVLVRCGDPLDEVVLRSYCIGAAHMALGWVTSEGLAVDGDGRVHDLTVRSFGILRASEMPPVEVHIDLSGGEPVNGSDAVFAAVAAAVWRHQGFPPEWPTRRALRSP